VTKTAAILLAPEKDLESRSSSPCFNPTFQRYFHDSIKCLAAGASDYIAKPVNTNELLSLLRVWLRR